MLKIAKIILFLVCFCSNENVRSDMDWPQWNIFDASIQLLGGMSETVVMSTIDLLCNGFLPLQKAISMSKPNVNQMHLQLLTPCFDVSVRLRKSKKLLSNPNFDLNKKVVVFITGWTTDINNPTIEEMAKAFHCRGGYNYLALDTSDFLQTFYDWSALNTEDIGIYLAESLHNLLPSVSAKNIYLVGHSLGAHIAGKAGRHFKKLTGQKLSRITGLDPASVCFTNANTMLTGVQRGDADFVDIIHTNPGGAGTAEIIGDVDFFPGGINAIKPGCYQFGCSHGRAISYYEETVYPENEKNFMAQKCNSMGYSCKGPYYTMGFAASTSLKGKYFMDVNPESPYGKNAKSNANRNFKKCYKCRH